jgi:hypothetical protein
MSYISTKNLNAPSLIIFIFLLLFSCAQKKQYSPILGIWDVQDKEGSAEMTWDFSLEDRKLTGIYSGSPGEFEMTNLVFEGKSLSFSVTLVSMTISIEAVIERRTLTGVIKHKYGQSNILGKKR